MYFVYKVMEDVNSSGLSILSPLLVLYLVKTAENKTDTILKFC